MKIKVVCALLVLVSACGRSDEQVAAQKQTLERVLSVVPERARLDVAAAKFDEGCSGFAECADASDQAPELVMPFRGGPDLCAELVEVLPRQGFRLVGAWHGDRVSTQHPSELVYGGPGIAARWIDVDAAACATERVHGAFLVKTDGSALDGQASVAVGFGEQPVYRATYEPTRVLPVDGPALTVSEMAHLRGVLDRPFVLAASPARDGIEAPESRTFAKWTVPAGVTALRFGVTCAAGNQVLLSVSAEAKKPTSLLPTDCTGAPVEVRQAAVPGEVTISVEMRVLPDPASSVRPARSKEPFVVEFTPVN